MQTQPETRRRRYRSPAPAVLVIQVADGYRSPALAVIAAGGGCLIGVADRLGVYHGTVSRWLNGTYRRPHPDLREAIAAETNDDIAATAMSLIGESVDDD